MTRYDDNLKLALAALVVGAAGLGMIYLGMARAQDNTAAFVCPETHPRTTGLALKETAADVARASAVFSDPEPENAIRVIART